MDIQVEPPIPKIAYIFLLLLINAKDVFININLIKLIGIFAQNIEILIDNLNALKV
jgi:hypothetical protein